MHTACINLPKEHASDVANRAQRHWLFNHKVLGLKPRHVSPSLALFGGAVVTSPLFMPECLPSLISLAHETGGAVFRTATSLVVPAGVIFAFLGFAVRIRERILLPSGS